MSFFPEFSKDKWLWAINLIKRNLEENPEYLDHPDCPYSAEEIDFLLTTFSNEDDETKITVSNSDMVDVEWGSEVEEISEMLRGLKSTRTKIKAGDAQGQMAYFRSASGLMEKLIQLQERAQGVKELSEFKIEVFRIIESVLPEEQRVLALSRLRAMVEIPEEEVTDG